MTNPIDDNIALTKTINRMDNHIKFQSILLSFFFIVYVLDRRIVSRLVNGLVDFKFALLFVAILAVPLYFDIKNKQSKKRN